MKGCKSMSLGILMSVVSKGSLTFSGFPFDIVFLDY